MTNLSISIIIPTFQRPGDLIEAARSVFSQTILDKTDCTLIVVDNDPDASAREAVEILRAEAPKSLKFIADHEPRAGVANARNRAIDHVSTDLIAFLDDDQSAGDPEWLEKLYDLHVELKPSVVFGPLVTILPKTVEKHHSYFKKFFGRMDPSPRGFIKHYHGGCNTLLDVSKLPKQRPLFDEKTNESGGEDDVLFHTIEKEGGTFAWEPDAPVFERVPIRRAHLGYTLKRAMVYGRGPVAEALLDNKYYVVPFWMMFGAFKAVYHGLRAGVGFLFKLDNRAEQLDQAVRGFGKIFFWRAKDSYGNAALRDSSTIDQEEVTTAPRA